MQGTPRLIRHVSSIPSGRRTAAILVVVTVVLLLASAATAFATGSFSGTVTYALSGETVPYPTVIWYRSNGSGAYFYYAQGSGDQNGAYSVVTQAGDYRVQFRDYYKVGAFEYFSNAGNLGDADTVTVVDGSDTPGVDAALDAPGAVSGTVFDTGGTPLGYVYVFAYQEVDNGPAGIQWVEVEETQALSNGTYLLGGLRPGSYKLRFRDVQGTYNDAYYDDASSFDTASDVPVTAGVTATGVDARMSLASTIAGTVTDEGSGALLGGIYVGAYKYVETAEGVGSWEWANGRSTASDGTYTMNGLAPGVYRIQFNDESNVRGDEFWNDRYAPVLAEAITLGTGETRSGIDAALAPAYTKTWVQHDAAGVTFDRWVTGYSGSYSGGGYVYGRWTGTRLDARFVGSRVAWVGPKQPFYGMADVYVDDVLVSSDVDCYAPATEATLSTTIWESGSLAPGPHTVSVRLTGAKNPSSTGNYVVIDRFEAIGVSPQSGGTRIDDTGATPGYSGTWLPYINPTYFNKTYAYSRWVGAAFTATFEGTKVAWIGPRTPNYGIADVYIDDAKVATVDTYRANLSTQGWREIVWESGTLAPGTHTIAIKPLGTKNPAATAANVVVDAIDVTP